MKKSVIKKSRKLKKSPKTATEYDYFEVMDRTNTVSIMFEKLINDHPFVKSIPSFKKTCDKISTLIGELYQDAGTRFFDANK